ncbi:MAG: hypothetical protein B7Z37_23215 [Verrucomicrobia bacterium 12-59-8]|nr:MAG: hypothetical protein B7Z37_23215 [Verrucomicrobia bacterium 12-59-8]
MEDARGIDPIIIQQLREAATAGKSATQLLALWQPAVSRGGDCRVFMMKYFREAFVWGIGEMTVLGAWSPFGDSAWTDEMIDAEYAPLLAEWRTHPRKRDAEG